MVQNELMKLYFALLNVSLYYFGYFVGVNNFVYMSVHSMSLSLTLCNFICVKNNNRTTTCKILGLFFNSAQDCQHHPWSSARCSISPYDQELYEIVSQDVRTKEAESFN